MKAASRIGLSSLTLTVLLGGITVNARAETNQPKETMKYQYVTEKIKSAPALDAGWESPDWKNVKTLEVANFHPDEASDHKPQTLVKTLYTDQGVYVLFKVVDKYVKSTNTVFQSRTCDDSCVEWFVRPKTQGSDDQRGYFNFELNCGGTLQCRYTKLSKEEKRTSTHPIDQKDLDSMKIYHSLPATVDPEIEKETTWYVGLYAPFTFFEKYVGTLGTMAGQQWRANFYKCGNKTSHPHGYAWAPVDNPNFHTPRCFGVMEFGK